MREKLTVIEQKKVEFYDEELIAIRADDGQVYVSIRHMCNSLGLDHRSQRRRIQRQNVLQMGYASGVILTPEGVKRTAGLLRVDLVPLWLSGISTNAVKESIQSKLERFQAEAAKVLWEAFQGGRLTADPTFEDLLQQDTPEVQAYKMLQGVLQLARNQIVIRSQLEEHANRLETIESQLSAPEHVVTQTQAMQISQSVKAVAIELGKQTGRNEFGGVYGEMYRKFEITSYKALPSAKFEACLAWLTEWHQTLTADTPF